MERLFDVVMVECTAPHGGYNNWIKAPGGTECADPFGNSMSNFKAPDGAIN